MHWSGKTPMPWRQRLYLWRLFLVFMNQQGGNSDSGKRSRPTSGKKPSAADKAPVSPKKAGSFSPKALSEAAKSTPKHRKPAGDKPSFRKRFEDKSSEESGGGKPERSFKRDTPYSDKPRRNAAGNRDEAGDKRPRKFEGKSFGDDRPKRTSSWKKDKPEGDSNPKARSSFGGEKPGRSSSWKKDKPEGSGDRKGRKSFGEDRPQRNPDWKKDKPEGFSDKKSYKSSGDDRPKRAYRKDDAGEGRPERRREDKPFGSDRRKRADGDSSKRDFKADGDKPRRTPGKRKLKPWEEEVEREQFEDKVYNELPTEEPKRRFIRQEEDEREIEGPMTLNKYLAHSGQCSRRDAAGFVKQGKVRVNGELVLDPGYRVQPGDEVSMLGKKMTPQRNKVYVLLNKPKGYITTTEDPQERKIVMDLVTMASDERLYPVGRLDRNTTGLLLMTNDGTLANKLSHPSYNIKKVYHVVLNKNLTTAHYDQIRKGLELEDGPVQVDEIAYLENRNELGVEIHSGKNRIVRRIFESLGYEIEKLDRVMYAGLTKKNLPRGKWRFLDEKEIILLKHFRS